ARERAEKDIALAEKFISENEPVLQELKNELEQANSEENMCKIREYTARINVITERLPKYEELKNTEKKAAALNKSLDMQKNQAAKLAENILEIKTELSGDNLELENLKDVGGELVSLKAAEEKLSERQTALSELGNDFSKWKKLEERAVRTQKSYVAAAESMENAQEKFRVINRLFMDSRAGIMAANLQDGRPCPVCGSLEHPYPAAKTKDAPTEEEVNSAEERLNAARKAAETANGEAHSALAEYETKKEALLAAAGRLWENIELDEIESKTLAELKTLAGEKTALAKKITAAENRLARKAELEKKIPKLTNKLEKLSGEHSAAEKEAVRIAEEEKSVTEQARRLSAELDYSSKTRAEAAIKEFEALRGQIEDRAKSAEGNLNQLTQKVMDARSRVEALKEQLKDSESVKSEKIEEDLAENSGRAKQYKDEKEKITIRLDKNRASAEELKSLSAKIKTSLERYLSVKALSDTANGDLTGKEKIRLETYVQTAYFDRIIARANTRLMAMTRGQYELARSSEAENLVGKSGLDLSVRDHYNGSTRSTKTLSGGESFLASLSLALGMSDEIQSSAGGV
ncbi:MAG: hypothetical protein ACI4SS_05085, partial [Clostridia bacterium]